MKTPTTSSRRLWLVHLLAAVLVAGVARTAQGQQLPTNGPIQSAPALAAWISNHLAQPRFERALWGVKIVSLDTGTPLFEHNAQKLFSPASNSKLFTTALALHRLGADYRIRTSLCAAKPPSRSGTLDGDLIVVGRGDPTLNARLHGDDVFQALEPLASALTHAGIRRVKGDLVADESYFRGPPFGSGWNWDDLEHYYGAEISSLTINDNVLRLAVKPGHRVGAPSQLALSPATSYVVLSNATQTITNGGQRSIRLYHPLAENVVYVSGQMPLGDVDFTEDIPVHKPAGLFAMLLKEAMARRGIKVSGRTRSVNWLERSAQPWARGQLVELGSVESPPLREIVREILKPSQNLYTDLLLAHVGALCQTTNDALARLTSEEAGVRELNGFLAEAGIEPGSVLFEEGSGLSRNNLATPAATVRLLEFMSRHPNAEIYRDALPIAGVDGTLKNRMKNTPAAGNVRAKTGTLRWANSLSGYVTTAAGERLAFCIMLNRHHTTDDNHPTRLDIDAIPVMLAEFVGRMDRAGE